MAVSLESRMKYKDLKKGYGMGPLQIKPQVIWHLISKTNLPNIIYVWCYGSKLCFSRISRQCSITYHHGTDKLIVWQKASKIIHYSQLTMRELSQRAFKNPAWVLKLFNVS